MTNARELAAHELLVWLERFDCAVWLDPRALTLCYHDPDRIVPEDVAAQLNALAPELRRILGTWGCRVGYHRIALWHLALIRRGGLETGCRVWLPDSTWPSIVVALPVGPAADLCQRCARFLVNRELARLPRVTPGREERRV